MMFSLGIQLLNFAVMWSLPFLFFEKKDGRLNVSWFLTALPFALGPTFMLLVDFGVLAPLPLGDGVSGVLRMLGVGLAVASTGLVVWTWRTHRVRLALWHMENDAPASIVTTGPYRWIRHPFYTSFLLGTLGALCHAPTLGLVATVIYAVVVLDRTADREERRLSQSVFGAEYVAYIGRTGRFLPRLGGR